jgi:drug/metabolite transporter (DMT)-like permease
MYSKPIFFVGIRMVVAGLLLYAISWWRHATMPRIKPDHWRLFFAIVIFHIYCAYVFDLWSLQYLTSFKSSFFFNLSPFITALFSYVVFGEIMTRRKWLGLSIGFLGFLPELLKQTPSEEIAGGISFLSWPELMLIGAVASACYGWIVMRMLMQEGYSPFFVNAVGMFGGGILALITSFFFEGWSPAPVTELWPFILLTSAIIIVINGIFYNLYGYLLNRYTATFLSFCGFMCPLFAALFGTVFLGETVTWHFFVASAVVVLGLYIFYQEELRQGYISGQ